MENEILSLLKKMQKDSQEFKNKSKEIKKANQDFRAEVSLNFNGVNSKLDNLINLQHQYIYFKIYIYFL